MNLVVTTEHRFLRTPDGATWTASTSAYAFWTRYLEVFDSIRVIARMQKITNVIQDWKRADGEKVSFAGVPDYLGPWQYFSKARKVARAVKNAVTAKDAVIMRVPSHIANIVFSVLRKRGQPFGLEVVGDPYDVFAPGAVRHPFRSFFRQWFFNRLRLECRRACGVAYVTRYVLPYRYPARKGSPLFHFSSTELRDADFLSKPASPYQHIIANYADVVLDSTSFTAAPRTRPLKNGRRFIIITVGSLSQKYKGIDVLIDAAGMCIREGLELTLIIIGDGKHRKELEAKAIKRGLKENVCFLGQLPGSEAVQAQLESSDLFVLPSKAEGLPRAMIEAMAQGLPCIGSTVGGIPELLPPEDMVPPGDVAALARKIREVLANPKRMAEMSERNLLKSQEYKEEVIRPRRAAMYRYIRQKTEEWQMAKGIL